MKITNKIIAGEFLNKIEALLREAAADWGYDKFEASIMENDDLPNGNYQVDYDSRGDHEMIIDTTFEAADSYLIERGFNESEIEHLRKLRARSFDDPFLVELDTIVQTSFKEAPFRNSIIEERSHYENNLKTFIEN